MIQKIFNRIRINIYRIKGAKIASKCAIYNGSEIRHPSRVHMNEGSVLYKSVSIMNDSNGSFSIGSLSHVAPFGYFLIADRSIHIGNNVAIGPFCAFYCKSNSYKDQNKKFTEQYSAADISIGNNVFIGSHCVVLPGSVVPDNVVIAASSVVKGILESGYIYSGNPAVKVKSIQA